jgi:hypothetical protein
MMKVIQERDKEKFLVEFEIFKQSCNACHIQEKVDFVKVVIPKTRLSPVEMIE